MDFIKKHYEKIILSGVLLGLVGALVCMLFIIPADKERLDDMSSQVINGTVKPLPGLNLMEESNAEARLESQASFDFSTTNKLFNPVEWKKAANGELIKIKPGNEIIEAVTVAKIIPLYFVLSLDSVITNELGVRYVISFEHQAAIYSAQRRGERYVSMDDPKKDLFTLLAVKGSPENPDELVLKLADTGETVDVSSGKPFQRVEAYSADLRYDLERKSYSGRREGSVVEFGGEDYIIVAIHQNEVILSAASNQKRTTLQYAP
jgi:hypothetical protein